MGVVIVEQGQPVALLNLRCEGQMPHRDRIDPPRPVQIADAGHKVTERQCPSDLNIGETERDGDILGPAAFADQPG
jgi:hypothetical protein